MRDFNTFFRQDAAYSDEKMKIYRRLSDDEKSFFFDETYAKIFFYAAILGFKSGRSAKLKKKKRNIPITVFSNKQKAILIALVIANTNGIDVLLDDRQTLKIIEEHANWGISELESLVIGGRHSFDDYLLTLKKDIRSWHA